MGKLGTIGAALATFAALPALAADELPQDWQFGLQQAATPVREHIDSLHNELMVIITLITLFVLALLLYVIIRFNAQAQSGAVDAHA